MTQKLQYATNVDFGLLATFNEPEIRDALQLGLLSKPDRSELKKKAQKYLQSSTYSEKRALEKQLYDFWKEKGAQYLREDRRGHGPEYIYKEILDYCV